ncbi:hypothetical protein COW36_08020 [bacterium (Candidatus Blackallbacteria) CG17_big_fil_post_rev_8_21_14_2_50_48_46]|uniref:Uncharacterized protein n=1 Tax=bacterium (Candidatus Blackallbacteria) CG17_big_fil_post_rev_8_21_14_2_50_48_46 TaxID=2014261 RepID=A0A2M7G620_9BACT|nr:MAG: hypothetical protein COW64_24560 [bacterium (Candidatus Blackallbacteria) CG18_big_fil_WC_8_21_14_2_50_49_26]PIW17435.1 MAG: hypothetical protein COW36_08020 [bacterium (Candidatus Blackallbacteria) CG17_big_fil_post_rev_8_21_14_2_50_48_46]PIW48289.1 MAG: hypothetical protein COW20_09375 [bacterium (Candidatus Blackallbacteria) CG13_big_fil_rev_8_21_14_2_50_49_14]
MIDFKPSERLCDRQAIISSVGIPEQCVLCEKPLPLAEEARFMMINETGDAVVCVLPTHFCEHCSAIYLEEAALNHVAQLFEFNPYAVVGFLDYSQIPEDKQHLPLGEDPDLPVPLVEFSSVQPLQAARLAF